MGADLRGVNRMMLDFCDDPDFVRELSAFSVDMSWRAPRPRSKPGRTSQEIPESAVRDKRARPLI